MVVFGILSRCVRMWWLIGLKKFDVLLFGGYEDVLVGWGVFVVVFD